MAVNTSLARMVTFLLKKYKSETSAHLQRDFEFAILLKIEPCPDLCFTYLRLF